MVIRKMKGYTGSYAGPRAFVAARVKSIMTISSHYN